MTKLDFLLSLHTRLAGLPQDEVEERLHFYSEMIEDRMEEGFTEEQAVEAVGSVDEIAAQIVADIPLAKIAKVTIKPKRQLTTGGIVLLVLGAPLWLPLLIAAVAVILSLYVSLWSVIISLWAVFVSLIATAFGVVIGGAGFAIGGNTLSGIAMIGAGLTCAGLAIFLFFLCRAATRGTVQLTKSILRGIKHKLINTEVTA